MGRFRQNLFTGVRFYHVCPTLATPAVLGGAQSGRLPRDFRNPALSRAKSVRPVYPQTDDVTLVFSYWTIVIDPAGNGMNDYMA